MLLVFTQGHTCRHNIAVIRRSQAMRNLIVGILDRILDQSCRNLVDNDKSLTIASDL